MSELKAVEQEGSMETHNKFIVENLPKLKTIRFQLLSKKPSIPPQRQVAALNAGANYQLSLLPHQLFKVEGLGLPSYICSKVLW